LFMINLSSLIEKLNGLKKMAAKKMPFEYWYLKSL
jgi:hypothetical protein